MQANPEIKNYRDEDLALECVKRPVIEEAWREFWRRFYPLLYRRVASLLRPFQEHPQHSDIDDILQLIFLKIFNSLSRFDRQKSPISAYLSLVATHTVFDQLRSGRGKQKVPIEELEELGVVAYRDEVEAIDLWEIVTKIFERLNPRKRAIVQAFLEGEDTDDICRKHSVTPTYVSTTVYRFRHAVKDSLKKK